MATIYEPAYTFVENRLDDVLHDGLGNTISAVEGPLRLALVLYVVLYGWAILRGSISEPILDGVVRLVKLAFIYVVATTVAYNSYVTEPLFTDLPNWLAGAISGHTASGVGGSFDSFFNRGGYLADKIYSSASVAAPLGYITGTAVWFVTALSTALGFGIVLLAKCALAVLVALGPIFIACLVFDATRGFFFGWLRQAVNYLLLFALILTVFYIILSLVEGQWSNIEGQANPNTSGLVFIALCCLGAIFFLQTPNIAAGIAGGAASGIGDFINAGRAGAAGTVAATIGAGKLGSRGAQAVGSRLGGGPGGTVRPTGGVSNGHPRR